MELRESRREGHILIQVRGAGVRVGDFPVLAAAVDKALWDSPESLAFEFRDCPLLDSGCIGQIAKAVRTMSLKGKPVFCIADDEAIWDGLQTVGLDALMRRAFKVSDYWNATGAAGEPV
jgi:hypothetical protein